jgi:hypothetical protein
VWDAYGPATGLAGATAVPRRLDSRAEWTAKHQMDASVVADREATRRFLAASLVPGVTGVVRVALPEGWGKTDKILRAGVSDDMVRHRRPASDSFRPPYWNVTMRDNPAPPAEAVAAVASAAAAAAAVASGSAPALNAAAAVGVSQEATIAAVTSEAMAWAATMRRPLAPVLPTIDAPFLPQFDTRARQVPHGRPATLHCDVWGMHRMPRPGQVPPVDAERLADHATAIRKLRTAEKEGILKAKLAAAQARARAEAATSGGSPKDVHRTRLPPSGPSVFTTGRTMPYANGNRLPLQSNLYEPTATRGLVIPAARTLYTKS